MEPVNVISGGVSFVDRADVDTDQIIPKQFLKRIERTGFEDCLFYDWLRTGELSLEPNPILVAGRNFGCGSSREHAVWAIQQFGFQAVIAPSIADIFYSNATKNGLLPIELGEEDIRAIATAGHATIDLAEQIVEFSGRAVPFEIDHGTKHRLLHGLDEIALTLQDVHDIDAYEQTRLVPGPSTTRL